MFFGLGGNKQEETGDQWQPAGGVAPPPSAPPPPPPPSDSDTESVRSASLGDEEGAHEYVLNNHQNNGMDYSSTSYQKHPRRAPVPIITNYGVSSNASYTSGKSRGGVSAVSGITEDDENTLPSMLRGNPNLNPNTGQTNDRFGGFGSLREMASRLRWITIGTNALAILWEALAFPTRVLFHAADHPAKVVLGAYLGIFASLLLGVEINIPLRDNFGFLYHPLGRGFLLFLMSGMAFGILADWWEILLSLAFFLCGFGYVYLYGKYPEYRRWQDYNDNQVWQEVRSVMSKQGVSTWTQPSVTDISAGWSTVQRETQSLLHTV